MKPLPYCLSLMLLSSPAFGDPLPRFPPGAVWNRDITTAPLHPQSADMIATLTSLGGFGFGRMQIDFGLQVVRAAAGSPTRTITGYPYDDYYSPDCEPIGTALPVPANAAIESSAGLGCGNASEDCHLLVVQGNTLYEAYHANASGASGLEAQCLVKWHLTAVYPGQGRGEHCSSADAAGFPIAPLLFNADEVHAAVQSGGDLGHALRFILPNERMASDASLGGTAGRLYVRPATHAGAPSGPVGSVPYGSRLRLRADFPLTGYSPAAQAVLRTMQRYGIVLADGGNIALTAESDRYTTRKWSELGLGSRVFDQTAGARAVAVGDFAVLDTDARIAETYDCVRTTVVGDTIFADGLE
jgi:serine/threonine-protein kinase